MSTNMTISRRSFATGLSVIALVHEMRPVAAQDSGIAVTKDANCGCCDGWVKHLRESGFSVRVTEVRDAGALDRVKERLGVPADLSSCHTAEVSGYIVEGHVPAAAIRRLLSERPKAKGLAAPGMPVGSPGMEVPGTSPEEYAVILFDAKQRHTFARYRGTHELPS